MAATADVTFWSFAWWIRHNPFKTFGSMSEQDFIDMAELFAATNSEELSATDPGGTYTGIEWPGGITAAQTTTSTDQSTYPDQHKGA